MNIFTKEELCALRDSRCYHMDDSYPSNDPLFKKIQSMIDNYCEHDMKYNSGEHLYCNKCEMKE